MKRLIGIIAAFLTIFAAAAQAEDCATASRLTRQAYDMKLDPATFAEQRRLLNEAIRLCPSSPDARNQLGAVLENEGHLAEALAQYQDATRLNPQFATAWFGVGEIYNKTGQFPLALEAYLHACKQDEDARRRIAELLTNNRFEVAPNGVIFEKASLLLLFDRARREELNALLRQCDFRSDDPAVPRGVNVKPAAKFPNILFDLGAATLRAESLRQIEELSAALRALPQARILVNGHTSSERFAGVASDAENRRRNQELSERRAETVAAELARRGMARERLETYGYGQDQPLNGDESAYAQNRRVEIEARQ